MTKQYKKISEEILHTNPWWTYKHDIYQTHTGKQGDYYYGVTPGNAMIIPILEDGRIILVLQERYLMGRQSIEFPCGGRKEGHSFQDTAKQELFEETGAIADEMINIGSFQALNGLMHDECHVFIAKVTEQHAQQLDDTECIDLLYRRPDEVEELISRNAIWDGQTMAAWALARSHFFKEKTPPSSPTFGPIQQMIDELIGN